ncbi:MAG TPA: Gfo/Idh/MocA family oxidoreductase [Geminicoccus sp.]|uniref:Gfo/Idh/MocA family protein n=1 Tax=Geminicoccus sp. TaxID=2024832 RepID=UPI002BA06800|nr:Gfo/Idh/MocA family oxidoreductase [Geminicoccus sp.]HWL71477.1 Gfo/Idh/MocA family oxidoreductase [Geminicoccus sp.]
MIGIGVLGYGYWGPNLARCFGECEQTRVVAIADFDRAARDRAARRHPGVTTVATMAELLDDPRVDAVAIATPVHAHFEPALAALRAGRHVLVEKPITTSSGEASRLVDEAARRGLTLMVDHTFTFTPAVQKIAELVGGGEIGTLHYYDSTRVNLGIVQSDVSVVWDLAVHDLAILDAITPERPVAIAAQAASHLAQRPETMAFVTLHFASGMVAHINVNWLAPVKVRRTLIGGSRQMIVWDDLEPSEKIKVYDKGVTLTGDRDAAHRLRVGYRSGDMWAPRLATTEALATEIDHFAGCIASGRTPLTDGLAGLRVVELLESAHWSMRQGGRPIDLSLERKAS